MNTSALQQLRGTSDCVSLTNHNRVIELSIWNFVRLKIYIMANVAKLQFGHWLYTLSWSLMLLSPAFHIRIRTSESRCQFPFYSRLWRVLCEAISSSIQTSHINSNIFKMCTPYGCLCWNRLYLLFEHCIIPSFLVLLVHFTINIYSILSFVVVVCCASRFSDLF